MGETELRWQLRQLPREIEPSRELWPGIADRLGRRPARRERWWVGLALAASVVMALGLGVRLSLPVQDPALAEGGTDLVHREAAALTREYEAALVQFQDAPMPAPLMPALATLDRSAAEIRVALAADPDAVFLLDQLRRTYARRLSLTQRAVIG